MASTAARSLRFVSVGQARLLNAYVEGVSRVRDEGTLESAINCPINRQHYAQENDRARLAAAVGSRLVKNHSFANGNKRTALLAANLFLMQNGSVLQQDSARLETNDAITRAHSDVAMGKMDEAELAELLRAAYFMSRSA